MSMDIDASAAAGFLLTLYTAATATAAHGGGFDNTLSDTNLFR